MTEATRQQLESMAASWTLPHGLVRWAEMGLLAAEGWPNAAISAALGWSRNTVGKWRQRFLAQGLNGLYDELRPGAPRTISDERVAAVVRQTLESKPADGGPWTVRTMAAQSGLGRDTVHRIWRTFDLQPHRQQHFKLSTDPSFVEKVRDIVGLYLDPPEDAVVLCVDEKTQIQALERSQPMLPLGLGYVEGVIHDYERHGTTILFAAPEVATGQVLGQCKPRHRHQGFLQFLRHLNTNVPEELAVHVIGDNHSTHKHPKTKQWLAAHLRFQMHYTPTYASWLNQISRRAIRRGSFRHVREPIQRIDRYREHANLHARPFIWTATTDSIFAKIQRLCEAISRTGH